MAVNVRPSRATWWQRYARRIRRSPEDLNDLMRVGARTPNPYPHIRLRLVSGKSEAYLPGTGLAVWEIAWLSRVYEGDVDAVARHLEACPITPALITEALEYGRAHPGEIGPVMNLVENMTEEQLREMLPGMTVITFDPNVTDEQRA